MVVLSYHNFLNKQRNSQRVIILFCFRLFLSSLKAIKNKLLFLFLILFFNFCFFVGFFVFLFSLVLCFLVLKTKSFQSLFLIEKVKKRDSKISNKLVKLASEKRDKKSLNKLIKSALFKSNPLREKIKTNFY